MSLFKVQSLFEATNETTVIQYRRLKTPWVIKNLKPIKYTYEESVSFLLGINIITHWWRGNMPVCSQNLLDSIKDARNVYMQQHGVK